MTAIASRAPSYEFTHSRSRMDAPRTARAWSSSPHLEPDARTPRTAHAPSTPPTPAPFEGGGRVRLSGGPTSTHLDFSNFGFFV